MTKNIYGKKDISNIELSINKASTKNIFSNQM